MKIQRIGALAILTLAFSGCLSGQGGDDDTTGSNMNDPCMTAFEGLDHECLANGLHLGEKAFWDWDQLPSYVNNGLVVVTPAGEQQEVCPDGCLDIFVNVGETYENARLRVAILLTLEDANAMRPDADLVATNIAAPGIITLFPPGSTDAVHTNPLTVHGSEVFSHLFLGGEPLEAGEWRIRLEGPREPEGMDVRMRATIEPNEHHGDVELPDLVAVPPFEIGFAVPTGTMHPGAPTPFAAPGASCMVEEYVEAEETGKEAPVLCLRFSMGLSNFGPGDFFLEAQRSDDDAAAQTAGQADVMLMQRLCDWDRIACEALPQVDGLVSRWHQTHMHYHYQNGYEYELYIVEGDELTFHSTSGKIGLQPTDECITHFEEFSNRPDFPGGPPDSLERGATIAAGWCDIYEWNRAGNYVDFPVDVAMQPIEGEYVIRGTTDALNQIQEFNETNNQSYAHFTVDATGAVTLLERGVGSDPWDPSKQVVLQAPF